MVAKYSVLTLFTILISFCISGCEERILIPGNSEIEPELIGVWSLVEADDLMEGDLKISENGKGKEYGLYGRDFIRESHDFSVIDYILEGNFLTFENRVYKRNSTVNKRSSHMFMPDEGLVKLFLIDEALPLIMKIGYNSNLDLFYKKISLWSPQFGYEVDTVWFSVTEDFIYPAEVNDQSDRASIVLGEGIGDPYNDEDSFFWSPWRAIYDTTFASGDYRVVYQGPVFVSGSFRRPISADEEPIPVYSYLQRFKWSFLYTGYVVPGLGTIHAEWFNDNERGRNDANDPGYYPPSFHHRISLVGYYNPLIGCDAGYHAGGSR